MALENGGYGIEVPLLNWWGSRHQLRRIVHISDRLNDSIECIQSIYVWICTE